MIQSGFERKRIGTCSLYRWLGCFNLENLTRRCRCCYFLTFYNQKKKFTPTRTNTKIRPFSSLISTTFFEKIKKRVTNNNCRALAHTLSQHAQLKWWWRWTTRTEWAYFRPRIHDRVLILEVASLHCRVEPARRPSFWATAAEAAAAPESLVTLIVLVKSTWRIDPTISSRPVGYTLALHKNKNKKNEKSIFFLNNNCSH